MRMVSSFAHWYRHSGILLNLFMLKIISLRCFKSEMLDGRSESLLLLKSRNCSNSPRPTNEGIEVILLLEMLISNKNWISLSRFNGNSMNWFLLRSTACTLASNAFSTASTAISEIFLLERLRLWKTGLVNKSWTVYFSSPVSGFLCRCLLIVKIFFEPFPD